MGSEALQRQERMGALADDLSNLPTGEEPVGTVYIPQTRKPFEGFEYFRRTQSGLNLLARVRRDHVGDLADIISRTTGKRYSVLTTQAAYDRVFVDPKTIEDSVLKEVAKYCWAHTREARVGNRIFSDPVVRYVDGEFRISGKSVEVEVDINDCPLTLERAEILKLPEGAKIYRGRIWTDPASVGSRWGSDEGACRVDADAPGGGSDGGVALLMRTDEVQERNVVEIDADDLEALQRKASDGEGWKERYEAAQKDFSALAKKHF